jgi:flagellar motor protein MotB
MNHLPLYRFVIGAVLVTVSSMSIGCRQPAASGLFGVNQSPRPTLFNFGGSQTTGNQNGGLFGGLANNQAGSSNRNTVGIQTSTQEQYQQFSAMAEQLRIANQRLAAYDADNQQLNTELAASNQKIQLANQYSQTLKDQLGDTADQIRLAQNERQSALQQLASMRLQLDQASQNQQRLAAQSNVNQARGQLAGFSSASGSNTRLAGGATIRANNSLMNSLSRIQIPGGEARMDGDVIRIEFPSDQVFVPGTYRIQPSRQPMLRNLVGTIEQTFPNQIVGIEAHWDGTPLSPAGTSDHQLTATQSLAMFDQLVSSGLPRRQMFTMAMASNRPRHPAGTVGGVNPNRRIEVVIYPESWNAR